jgi:hypothetical protein
VKGKMEERDWFGFFDRIIDDRMMEEGGLDWG